MTFEELRDAVSEIIDQSLADDTKKITKTMVNRFLNIGYRRAVNSVIKTYEDFYMREATADLVANQKAYSLPSDLRKVVKIDIGYDTSSTRYQGLRQDKAFSNPNDTFSTASPVYYLVGDTIELNPVPDSAVTDGLRIYYIEKQNPLTSDSDEIKLPIGYEDLPVLYAIAKVKQVLELESEAQAYIQEFQGELRKMKSELINRTKDNNDSVVMRDSILDVWDN